MEGAEDAVRVMTVHAAKGLEAKIVFLPDTCGVPSPRHDPKIFALDTKVPGEQTIGWSPRKDLDCEAIAAARRRRATRRWKNTGGFFYVALTRAEERLYIAGFHGAQRARSRLLGKDDRGRSRQRSRNSDGAGILERRGSNSAPCGGRKRRGRRCFAGPARRRRAGGLAGLDKARRPSSRQMRAPIRPSTRLRRSAVLMARKRRKQGGKHCGAAV